MTPLKRAALSSLMALSLAGPALAAPLSMPLATQQRLHLATASAASIRQSETVSGYAKILDPLPLASLDADLTSAIAVADASRAEAARAKSLNANGSAMSLRAVEAAQAQARVDAARVTLYRRQLAIQWGPIGTLSDARRTVLIDLLTTGQAALVRIENKTYGICRVTGRLIDKARLRAVPHATLSLEAKLGYVKNSSDQ